jgi:hypothetical protein
MKSRIRVFRWLHAVFFLCLHPSSFILSAFRLAPAPGICFPSNANYFNHLMKSRFLSFLALSATVGALNFLTGCANGPSLGGGGNYNPVAYRPHNPDAVRVKVSLSKQVVYVTEGSKTLLVAATNVGLPDKPTPKGNFRIFSKQATKRSGSYGFWTNGSAAAPGKSGKSTLAGGHYVGYPMAYWCEFSPAYGFHQGYVWPQPRTHGCLRLHKTVAPKFFALVKIGTPVNIAYTQPEDATIGANVQRPTDYRDDDPPATFMVSSRVFDKPAGNLLVSY